jgi:hypothetical protein
MYRTDEFWSENWKGKHNLEDLDINRSDLKWIVQNETVNCIFLAHDSEEWRAVLKFRSLL